jgi:hypothetical protein
LRTSALLEVQKGRGELRVARYIVEVSSRNILTAGEDCGSLSHTNILSKFLKRDIILAK